MTIRSYRETDFPAVLDIYAASKLDELIYEDQRFQLLPLDQDLKRLEGFRNSRVFVFEQDGLKTYAALDQSEITALFIHPKRRGTGIGRTLMQHMLERAEGEATLYVAKSNLPAKRLYEQFGFVITSEFMTDYNGIPILANKMVRKA
ncbi:GNAT family N-acetyltransferase [Pseudovibrio sp. Ad37]|uniref:GNAT family N-acetyltransferase n=1 Tax=Pseudovibrio sp. Ad37 TaxID=989422 RepID=UPI0007AE6A0B|nr:N-acetyltransferase [Pseudovibrio sp. Ad37]KZL27166.1 putative N-acetyltransferase YjaB [Pseudovibrio sp. Ad37]